MYSPHPVTDLHSALREKVMSVTSGLTASFEPPDQISMGFRSRTDRPEIATTVRSLGGNCRGFATKASPSSRYRWKKSRPHAPLKACPQDEPSSQ